MRLLRVREVLSKTGLSRASVYEKMNAGTFPQSTKLGEKAVGWSEAEVDEWISARLAARGARAEKAAA